MQIDRWSVPLTGALKNRHQARLGSCPCCFFCLVTIAPAARPTAKQKPHTIDLFGGVISNPGVKGFGVYSEVDGACCC
jgi:hypothetical protein